MAEDLDDGEFWLPSEFLADDMFKVKGEGHAFFPGELPYGFDSAGSSLSSPVESVVGSTETESDEEDYMAGLTRQMAHSTLQDDDGVAAPAFAKGVVAGSPQSTLCVVGSLGSSKGPSLVSSPPSTPLYHNEDDALDLLYAAAGEVVRMKMNDQTLEFHGRGVLGPPRKLSSPPSALPITVKSSSAAYFPNHPLTQQQLRIHQFEQLKQQQMIKQQQQQCLNAWGRQAVRGGSLNQQHARVRGYGNGRNPRAFNAASSAWPGLQHQQQHRPSSGMRAVFLEGHGSNRESSGTGVFLPRTAGAPADFRKKPACATVLLPARVVQALNLNLDELGTAQPRFHGSSIHDQGAAMLGRGNTLVSQQERHAIRFRPTLTNQEIRLPREWTY